MPDVITAEVIVHLDVHDLDVTCDDVVLIDVEGDTFTLICCDCGLTHRIGIVRHKDTGKMMMMLTRDERATAQHRRKDRIQLHKGVGKWKLVRID